MDPYNLAICFGPTLLPIPGDRDQVQFQGNVIELMRNIILHCEDVFPNDGQGIIYEKCMAGEEDLWVVESVLMMMYLNTVVSVCNSKRLCWPKTLKSVKFSQSVSRHKNRVFILVVWWFTWHNTKNACNTCTKLTEKENKVQCSWNIKIKLRI